MKKTSNGKTTEGEAYTQLRIRLLQHGHSLRSFAILHGYPVGTVYSAARGLRAGKTTLPIKRHLERFAKS